MNFLSLFLNLCTSARNVADTTVYDAGRNFRIRHTAHNGRSLFLTFHCDRLKCMDCSTTFTQKPYWMHPELRMTRDLALKLSLDLAELLPISVIACANCVPPSLVSSFLDRMDMPRPQKLPVTLCIDEFKGDSGTWDTASKKWGHIRFQCAVPDGDAGSIVDILPETTAGYLVSCFSQYPLELQKRVRYFCCDMHNAYPSLAKRCFPDATICIGLSFQTVTCFHVVNRLNTAVDEVRRRLQNTFLEQGDTVRYGQLKHSSCLLKTALSNQASLWKDSVGRKAARLEDALSVSPDLGDAYGMLQEFHLIMEESHYAMKRSLLTDWLHRYASSEIPEIRSAAATVQHWRGYIQNSFKPGKSNGPCEGLNNKIKVLKRISFGVHDFETFWKRILLTCGYTHWCPDTAKYAMARVGKRDICNG